jgi:hypothetical protein
VPGLVPGLPQLVKLRQDLDKVERGTPEYEELLERIEPLTDQQQQTVGTVQLFQELGGLAGRFALAYLALRILSRQRLLRLFQIPGLILIALVYFGAASGNLGDNSLTALKYGLFLVGFCTVAQFSFWGNYLPRVYPVYLRGTGESFAANVGGRMVGTIANPIATTLAPLLIASIPSLTRPAGIAYAAGIVGVSVYLIGVVVSFWLPEPGPEEAHE